MATCYNCGSENLNPLGGGSIVICENCGVVFEPGAYRLDFPTWKESSVMFSDLLIGAAIAAAIIIGFILLGG